MARKFKPGTVVVLKSNAGPQMVVVKENDNSEDGKTTCLAWLSEDSQATYHNIETEALMVFE